FFLGDLADRLADILFQLRLVIEVLDHQPDDPAADAGRVLVQRPRPALRLGRRTQLGVAHLSQLLLFGPGGHLTPRRRDVVQVPVFQREAEARAHRSGLTEYRQTLGPQLFDPPQRAAMDFTVHAAR